MKHARGKKWTSEEDAMLILCSNERYKELAKDLGISVNAVSHHARTLGCFKFRWGKHKTKAEPEPVHVWGNNKGQPCPPPAMDLMHREVYVPKPWLVRDGSEDAKLCPSRQPEAAAVYRKGHP